MNILHAYEPPSRATEGDLFISLADSSVQRYEGGNWIPVLDYNTSTIPSIVRPTISQKSTFTSTQLKALNGTPQVLLPNAVPFIAVPLAISFRLRFGTIAYVCSSPLEFLIGTEPLFVDASSTDLENLMKGTTDQFLYTSVLKSTPSGVVHYSGGALTMTIASDMTTGDSTLDVTVDFQIYDAS